MSQLNKRNPLINLDPQSLAKVRSEKCLVEIQSVLKKYNCGLNAICHISGINGIATTFEVIPLKDKDNNSGGN